MYRPLALAALVLMAAPAGAQTDWHPDAAKLCLASPSETPQTPAEQRLAALLSRLDALGPEAAPLRDTLAATGTALCLDDRLTDAHGAYHLDHNLIALEAALEDGPMLAILLHELRHLDQSQRGYCPRNDISMEENARATFAMEADAQAIATLTAWQLRAAGDPAAWIAFEEMPDYADIAARFASEMAAGTGVSAATAAAFDQWYANTERLERYYAASCSDYLDRQDASKLLPSYGTLPADFLDALCRLPGGATYDCAAPPAP